MTGIISAFFGFCVSLVVSFERLEEVEGVGFGCSGSAAFLTVPVLPLGVPVGVIGSGEETGGMVLGSELTTGNAI